MDRRIFLKKLSAATLAGAGMTLNPAAGTLLKFARAATGGNKTLVVIFQRGGCDGLNAVVPYADPDYRRHRPTLAIPAPGAAERAALDLDGFFGLHPSLAGLHEIYQENNLAVFPAVHYPDASRSHFDSQRLIEGAALQRQNDGWLNRVIQQNPNADLLNAVALGSQLPFSLFGDIQVPSFDSLQTALGAPEAQEPAIQAALDAIFRNAPPTSGNRDRLYGAGRIAMEMLDQLALLAQGEYVAENGANYADDGFAQQLKQVARLIKADVGLEIATLNIGGWDTHSNQGAAEVGGTQARRFAIFADGLRAFYRDMADRRDDVMVLTMTEFGRTVQENASGGTDHGKASAWFAFGGQTQGGVHGGWPGLDEADLDQGRFLRYTVDYRHILADVLSGHLGVRNLGAILPDLLRVLPERA